LIALTFLFVTLARTTYSVPVLHYQSSPPGQDLPFKAASSPTCFNLVPHIAVSSRGQALVSRIVTWSVQVWNNADLRFKNGPWHFETSESDSLKTNSPDSGSPCNVSKPLPLLVTGLTCPPRWNIGQLPTSWFYSRAGNIGCRQCRRKEHAQTYMIFCDAHMIMTRVKLCVARTTVSVCCWLLTQDIRRVRVPGDVWWVGFYRDKDFFS